MSDFAFWKRKMKNVLIQQDVDLAIDEDFLAETKEEGKDKIIKKATSCIELCLANNVLWQIQDLKTDKEIWEMLETLYDHKTLSNKIFLKERLFGFKLD